MSTSGVKWAAAVMPIELSIMQPTMTVIECARAAAIMRIASRRLPHLASLMLIPSTRPTRPGMSALVRQLSSAMTGIDARRRISPSPSRSCGTSGCSSTVTPNSASTGSMRTVCFTVQPQFASTRISRSVASRMARRISRSRSLPSLIFSTGYSAASSTFIRIRSAVSMPIVNVESGARLASSPHSFQTGTPRRLPTRSCRADESAARAEPLPRSASSHARSVVSRSNGSAGSIRPYTCSAASTDSGVSP